ncbi:universal stress protein [Candidatus Nitrosocosmicus agrestis]|uniref:universal stress protein n=1 Tax=Candidatus Nitrosocosmicus agrestis TaxID=2563600 RepID=UPI00122DCE90|nr:universal stress protein [Candidatus Nitrosocosmicus sp. SS]KAA2283139.1 universal stress protein [Candidatus Nitrosocosmicus sp. SS]KAF0868595.1 universal stress protein [Candidatus Nitrosocosmicus sp. SS]
MDLRVILVPYDSSHFSENALEYAVYLAKAIFRGDPKKRIIKIIMLHVIQEIPFTKSLLMKMKIKNENENSSLNEHANSIYEETKTLMQKDMDKKKTTYKSIEGIKLESLILYGDPSNQIIDYSSNNRVDLIVMGSNGLQGLSKFKGLGSVSRKVSEAVSCPMTIIR